MSITLPTVRSCLSGLRSKRSPGSPALALALLLLVSASMQVFAQDRPKVGASTNRPLSVVLSQVKVLKDADGRERFAPVAAVIPGDVIEYRATYRNTSDAMISGVSATLPVPKGTRYVPKSASVSRFVAEVATPDGSFGREPLMRTVKGVDGKPRVEAVPYSQYRMLRWALGRIPGKGEVTVKARVQVELYESAASGRANASHVQPAATRAVALADR